MAAAWTNEILVRLERVNETEKELVPRVAVTLAVWGVVMVAAVAEKVAVAAPAGTVTEVGTESVAELLLARVTAVPPEGAAWFSVAVQVETAPEARVVGEQLSPLSSTAVGGEMVPPVLVVVMG